MAEARRRVSGGSDGGAPFPMDDIFDPVDHDKIVPYQRDEHWDDSPFPRKLN